MSGDPYQSTPRSLNQLDALFTQSTDTFDKLLAESSSNKADLPAHYPYSPSNYRLFEDATRKQPEYGEDALFADLRDSHQIQPTAGTTVKWQTAERFRYVVNYESLWSLAIEAEREPVGDEELLIILESIRDSTETPQDWVGLRLTADDTELVIQRNDTTIQTRSVELERPITEWTRFEFRYSWYNVGNTVLRQSYTDANDELQNVELGTIAEDKSRAERAGNGRITVQVDRDAGTDSFNVDAGSISYLVLGDVTPKSREKQTIVETGGTGGTGDYEAIAAFRVQTADKFEQITADLQNLAITSGPSDVDLTVQAVNPDLTDASGFSTPAEHSADGVAVEQTTSISQFPDSSGTQVSQATNPGGYQLAFTSRRTEGSGGTATETQTQREVKSRLHDTDEAVVLARTDVTDAINFSRAFEEEW